MSTFNWDHLFQFLQFVVTAVISFLMYKANRLTTLNGDKMDTVVEQTNGINAHLVKITGESEHAKGKLEEKAEEKSRVAERLRIAPLESIIGPDRLHAGKMDEPA
jgi:hypothetical protein